MKQLSIILAIIIAFGAAQPAEPATLEVRPSGGVGALGDVYTSIQQAIDDANAGDTINVAAGVYEDDTVGPDDHLVIDKANLTLRATDGNDSTTINVANGVGIDIRAGGSGFVLGGSAGHGFTIAGGADTSFVIQLTNAPSGVEISHNIIGTAGNASMGVSVGAAGAADLTISNNGFVADSGDGCVWGPRFVNLTVSDNTFDGGAYAIQTSGVTSSSPSVISGNVITGFTGSGGIVICNGEATSDLSITGNTITGCTSAIRFAEYCAQGTPGDMTTVTIEDNTLSTNDKGIRIGNGAHVLASNFTIQNNCINGNTSYGLQNEHATEVVTAEKNAWGDASGPYHSVTNTSGLGDEVSNNVDYYPWYPDCNFTTPVSKPVHNITIDAYYDNIQPAVDEANPGDQIAVAAGTFVEQLEITIPLTITGAGQGSTVVQSPDNLTLFYTTSADNYPIVYLHDVAGVTIKELTVDGAGKGNANYRFNGIAFRQAGGTIQNVTLINVMDTPFSGAQHGVAIYAYNDDGTDRNINILNCTVQDFQKNAIALNGANAICHVEGCVVTGAGDTTVTAQNGIQFGWGSQGTIKSNTVSNVRYTGAGWSASGILGYGDNGSAPINVEDNTVTNTQGALQIYFFNGDVNVADNNLAGNDFSFLYAFDSGTVTGNSFDNCMEGLYLADVTNITGSGNTFNDCNVGLVVDGVSGGVSFTQCEFIDNTEVGIAVVPYESDNPNNVVINCCQITGNADYGVENTSSNVVDATVNWWGDATGPSGAGGGSGDSVSENVDFFPWLLSDNIEECAELTEVVADFVVDDDWASLPDYTQVFVGAVDYYISLNAFDDIQPAVDAADPCNMIYVQDGNYSPFTVDGKTNLTITSASTVTVQGVQSVATAYNNRDCVVFVKDSTNVVLQDLNIEGSGLGSINAKSYGVIYENSSGHIKDCNVSPNTIGDMSSNGIGIWDGSDVNVDPTLVHNFGRIGIFIYNGCNVEVLDSEIIGQVYSDGNLVNYGIEVEGAWGSDDPASASQVMIKRNMIYNCDNTDTEVKWGSSAILINGWLEYMAAADSTVTIVDNDIYDNYSGVYAIKSSSSRATLNNIYGNRTTGVESAPAYDGSTAVFDAEYNYWGDVSGPNDPCGTTETDGASCPDVSAIKNADGLGDGVSENASYCAWLTAPACTSANPCLAGDLNFDGCVNWEDVAILADEWLQGCE